MLESLMESARLRSEFGALFSECARCNLSCPPGWYTIIRDLCAQLSSQFPWVRIAQVKPKAGSLRVYLHYPAQQLIDEAAAVASATCEKCGAPGMQVGWHVLCDGCDK